MANSIDSELSSSLTQPERGDVFLVVLHAPDRESLARLLRDQVLDVGPIHPVPDSAELVAHLYADREQIEKLLKDYGWRFEVQENLSEIGRRRQKEVGHGDRFEGGRIPPKGLGQKPGKENKQ